jgi:hypothetical protein
LFSRCTRRDVEIGRCHARSHASQLREPPISRGWTTIAPGGSRGCGRWRRPCPRRSAARSRCRRPARHLYLHLHRFDDDRRLASPHCLAGLNQHTPDAARNRAGDCLAAGRQRILVLVPLRLGQVGAIADLPARLPSCPLRLEGCLLARLGSDDTVRIAGQEPAIIAQATKIKRANASARTPAAGSSRKGL